MSNPYRIKSTDLFTRVDDDIKETPDSVVFIATEGNVTEYNYFRLLDKYRGRIGISKLVRIEAIKRSSRDTNSSPEAVLDLMKELLDLHDNGITIDKLNAFIPDGYNLEFVRKFLENDSSAASREVKAFQKKMENAGLNLSYLRFISEYGERDDVFCLILDKDKASHSSRQLMTVMDECRKLGAGFFISSPCFEFWLLLHLCDVKNEYARLMDKIKENARVSGAHTFVSREVSYKAKHTKHIPESVFVSHYLGSIRKAIEQSQQFETDAGNLIKQDTVGTNIGELFAILFSKKKA